MIKRTKPQIFKSNFEEMNYNLVTIFYILRYVSEVEEKYSSKGGFFLRLETIYFLQQNNKADNELENYEWWYPLAYICDITVKYSKLNQDLQGENKMISQIANKVFAIEEKLKIYYQKIQNQIFHNSPTLTKAK